MVLIGVSKYASIVKMNKEDFWSTLLGMLQFDRDDMPSYVIYELQSCCWQNEVTCLS